MDIRQLSVGDTQAVLPSSYDRFCASSSFNVSHKPASKSERSWVLIAYPVTNISHDPKVVGDNTDEDTTEFSRFNEVVHPEGSKFSYAGRVVSSQLMTEELQALGKWLIERSGFASKDRRVTAFVILDTGKVKYYLVDHMSKSVFWLSGEEPEGISGFESNKTRNTLAEEYWIHMENFPAPTFAARDDLRTLKAVLSSLAIDAATSDGSTSPFSPSQIHELLHNLEQFSGTIDIYQTYAVARLWCMVCHTRMVNSYGAPGACLDRFIVLYEKPPVFSGKHVYLAKLLVGAGVEAHLMRCSRAWAGRIAYVSEWRSFKAKNETEWTRVMDISCILAIASLLAQNSGSSQLIFSFPLVLACLSAASSYCLIGESQNLGEQAADAALHFQYWEGLEYGVQRLALRNSAPQALLIWGCFTFFISILVSKL